MGRLRAFLAYNLSTCEVPLVDSYDDQDRE